MKPFLGVLVVLMVVLVASPVMAGRFWVAPVVPVVPATTYYDAYYAPSGMAYFPPTAVVAPVAPVAPMVPVAAPPAMVYPVPVAYPYPYAYPAVIRARVYYPGWWGPRAVFMVP